jgi:hypothetical protein
MILKEYLMKILKIDYDLLQNQKKLKPMKKLLIILLKIHHDDLEMLFHYLNN